jgi:Bacterial PH domain
VIWWIWVVFVAANLIDLAFTGRDWYSVLVIAVLAVITGLMYAVALRPRVITDEHGITVLNPLRDHRVPWGAVSSVTVGESVQVRCGRGPGSGGEKVVHSWALYASRRTRVKKDFPGRRQFKYTAQPPPSYAKLPRDAQELLRQSPADQIAAELELQARLARERGAPPGERVASWPWNAVAAVLIPGAALVIVLLAH